MKTTNKTLYIIDGNALLHRAWHAVPPLATKDGLIVNAVYGFTNVVEKIRLSFKPDYLCVAWDLPEKTFRHEAVESYKATRVKKEPELYAQIPMIQELLLSYHVPSYSAPGYEADDVIGTIAEMVKSGGAGSGSAGKQNVHVVIVTGDMDALQLVDDHVNVLSFVKGVSETKVYDVAAVIERVGLKPEQLIDYKALRGDTSDNIKGIAGIGEKGALELILKFGTIDGIFDALKKGEVPSKFAKKLEGNEKVAEESKMLVTIIRHVPMKFHLDETVYQAPNLDSLLELFRKYEFRSLLRKYSTAMSEPQMEVPPIDDMRGERSQEVEKERRKEVVSSRAERSAAEGSLRSSSNSLVEMTKKIELVRDIATLELALQKINDTTIGILLGTQTPDLFGTTYAAFAISDGTYTVCVMSPSKILLDALHKKISHAEKVVMHDEKFLMHTLGWKFTNEVFDVMIASYLLKAGFRTYDLASLLTEQLGIKNLELPVSYTSEKDYKKIAEFVQHLPALEKVLRKKLHETEQEKVFDEIEMPLIPVLYRMEEKGIEVDVKALGVFSKELAKNITSLEKKIRDIAGEEVNVNSPAQLAHVLFETLQLSTKHIKKTKTGFSTAASELEKLMDEHEIVPMISEYRELAKLQSTYVEALT
ncbi:MAG: DNA polymerase, partial [Patescibacteria group bacterium]